MDLTCLQTGLSHVSEEIGAFQVDDLPSAVIVSVLLAVPLSPVVLRLYHRRVQKLMSEAAEDSAAVTGPVVEITKPGDSSGAATTARELLHASETRGRALWKALALAVALFSGAMALVIPISPDAPGTFAEREFWEWLAAPVVYLLFVGSLCAPMVLLGVASTRFAPLFWKWYAPIYVAIVGLAMIFDDSMPAEERVGLFVGGLAILAVLYIALGGRRMRNVVPLLSVLIGLLLVVVVVLGNALEVVQFCTDQESVSVALAVSALTCACLWLAWRAVLAVGGRVARAYEKKRFSEAQFQVGAWMTVITVIIAFAPGPTDAGLNVWSLGVIPPLIGALWLYRKLLRRLEPWQPAKALLLLRVFARDRRGERLLDEVAFRWRFIGPIHMIGGPDLAKINLDPDELLLFLRRRLRDIFITDRSSLQRRLAALDREADPDARYRINESYCSDNMWQQAVGALLDRSDAVLLDLRGFTAARQGTAFEIRLLAERGALARTVVLMDGGTDLSAIEQTIADVPGAALPPERVVRSDGPVEGADMFALLADAAALPRAPAVEA